MYILLMCVIFYNFGMVSTMGIAKGTIFPRSVHQLTHQHLRGWTMIPSVTIDKSLTPLTCSTTLPHMPFTTTYVHLERRTTLRSRGA